METINLGQVSAIYYGDLPPNRTTVVWVDTYSQPNVLKVYVNGIWITLGTLANTGELALDTPIDESVNETDITQKDVNISNKKEIVLDLPVDGSIGIAADFGAIPKGTPVSEFDDDTLRDLVIKALLVEFNVDIITSPNSTISRGHSSLIEPNVAFAWKPTVTFTRGSYDNQNNGVSDGELSGLPTTCVFTSDNGFSQTVNFSGNSVSINGTIDLSNIGRVGFNCRSNYEEGELLYTNFNNIASSVGGGPNPYPAGFVNVTDSVETVLPFFATSQTPNVATKQNLKTLLGSVSSSYVEISMVEHLGTSRQFFEIPQVSGITVCTKLELFNDISQSWDEVSLDPYTITDIVDPYGYGYDYKRYTYDLARGGARLRVYFK